LLTNPQTAVLHLPMVGKPMSVAFAVLLIRRKRDLCQYL